MPLPTPDGPMSLVTVVAVPAGIAISADSRRTLMPAGASRSSGLVGASLLWDREQKLHVLWGHLLVANIGAADAAGLPVSTHLRQWGSSGPGPRQFSEVGPSLRAHFRAVDPSFDSTFIVAATRGTEGGPRQPTAIVLRLHEDFETELPPLTAQWFGGRKAVENVMLTTLTTLCPPVFERMDLAGAIDYSRHLIRTVIDQTRFGAEYSPVGGEIDTAVAAHDGNGWVIRKPL